jgi:hypothetical protein
VESFSSKLQSFLASSRILRGLKYILSKSKNIRLSENVEQFVFLACSVHLNVPICVIPVLTQLGHFCPFFALFHFGLAVVVEVGITSICSVGLLIRKFGGLQLQTFKESHSKLYLMTVLLIFKGSAPFEII